jgi:hypothetical protein
LGSFRKGDSRFAVAIDVFPCLGAAIDECVGTGANDVSVLIVQVFDLVVVLSY